MSAYQFGDVKHPVPPSAYYAVPSASVAAAYRVPKRSLAEEERQTKRARFPKYDLLALTQNPNLWKKITEYRRSDCEAATKDGTSCGRAWQYSQADAKNPKIRTQLDCSAYCVEEKRCLEWMTEALSMPPQFIKFWTTDAYGRKKLVVRQQIRQVGLFGPSDELRYFYYHDDKGWVTTFESVPEKTATIAASMCEALRDENEEGNEVQFEFLLLHEDMPKELLKPEIKNNRTLSITFEGTSQPDNVWIRPNDKWNIDIDEMHKSVRVSTLLTAPNLQELKDQKMPLSVPAQPVIMEDAPVPAAPLISQLPLPAVAIPGSAYRYGRPVVPIQALGSNYRPSFTKSGGLQPNSSFAFVPALVTSYF